MTLFGKPRPIPSIIKEYDRRLALKGLLRGKKGDERAQPGSNSKSAEVTVFVLFFVTFAKTIGKSMEELEIPHQSVGVEVIKQDEIFNPRVDPPRVGECNGVGAEGQTFDSLHSNFRPDRIDPPEDIVLEDDDDQQGELCLDRSKAISPSSFMKWTFGFESSHDFDRSIEQYELETEKARIVTKAQIDLGFNLLKTMRRRKLRNEAINYKVMIEACGRCSIAHRATDLMEMMSKDGVTLDQETYFSFISAFSNCELFFHFIYPLTQSYFYFSQRRVKRWFSEHVIWKLRQTFPRRSPLVLPDHIKLIMQTLPNHLRILSLGKAIN